MGTYCSEIRNRTEQNLCVLVEEISWSLHERYKKKNACCPAINLRAEYFGMRGKHQTLRGPQLQQRIRHNYRRIALIEGFQVERQGRKMEVGFGTQVQDSGFPV